jgi:tetratricopeptide (TPR) repeat protein
MKRLGELALVAVLVFACAQTAVVDKYVEEAAKLQKSGELAKAVEVLEKAAKEHPNRAKVQAYLGLYLGMQAGQTHNFMEAGELVRSAFAHLDKAVALDSADSDARFFRGMMSVQVPDFFGKLEAGVRDLEFVLKHPGKNAKPDINDRLVATWSLLGTGYQKQNQLGKASQAWQKVAELAQDTALVAKARARLSDLGVQNSAAPQPELPASPAALRELGRRSLDSADYMLAADALRKLTQLDSTDLEAFRLLAQAIDHLVSTGYDERIALNTDLRTQLAFEYWRVLDRMVRLAPQDMQLLLRRGAVGVHTPFFVGRLDDGIKDLEAVAATNVDDSTRAEALYLLGVGYRRKGISYWTKVASKYAKSEAARQVLEAMRPPLAQFDAAKHEKPVVAVSFVLGFQDELAPQTAVWVEDTKGNFVKTLYVSGFSGHAKAVQVDLPHWALSSEYRGCDAVTGASIDLGQHIYTWDMKDLEGKPVQLDSCAIKVEAAWWPSMKAEIASVRLALRRDGAVARAAPAGLIPYIQAQYLPR